MKWFSSFRAKLILTVFPVVAGITISTLVLAEWKFMAAYRRLFEEQFESQINTFTTAKKKRSVFNSRPRAFYLGYSPILFTNRAPVAPWHGIETSGQDAPQPLLQIGNFLWADRVLHRVGMPLDLVTKRLERVT